MKKGKAYIQLHLLFLLYSLGAVCSKYASQYEMMSRGFILYYGLVLLNLFVYAIVWQQILKKIPLISAYSNKAVTVIWGLLWGILLFHEKITLLNVVGALIIIVGIIMVVQEDAV